LNTKLISLLKQAARAESYYQHKDISTSEYLNDILEEYFNSGTNSNSKTEKKNERTPPAK